jgi:hypothetical protein
MGETSLIRALQQSRTEHSVNMHSGRHDSSGDLVDPEAIEKTVPMQSSNLTITLTKIYPVIPCVLCGKDLSLVPIRNKAG